MPAQTRIRTVITARRAGSGEVRDFDLPFGLSASVGDSVSPLTAGYITHNAAQPKLNCVYEPPPAPPAAPVWAQTFNIPTLVEPGSLFDVTVPKSAFTPGNGQTITQTIASNLPAWLGSQYGPFGTDVQLVGVVPEGITSFVITVMGEQSNGQRGTYQQTILVDAPGVVNPIWNNTFVPPSVIAGEIIRFTVPKSAFTPADGQVITQTAGGAKPIWLSTEYAENETDVIFAGVVPAGTTSFVIDVIGSQDDGGVTTYSLTIPVTDPNTAISLQLITNGATRRLSFFVGGPSQTKPTFQLVDGPANYDRSVYQMTTWDAAFAGPVVTNFRFELANVPAGEYVAKITHYGQVRYAKVIWSAGDASYALTLLNSQPTTNNAGGGGGQQYTVVKHWAQRAKAFVPNQTQFVQYRFVPNFFGSNSDLLEIQMKDTWPGQPMYIDVKLSSQAAPGNGPSNSYNNFNRADPSGVVIANPNDVTALRQYRLASGANYRNKSFKVYISTNNQTAANQHTLSITTTAVASDGFVTLYTQ